MQKLGQSNHIQRVLSLNESKGYLLICTFLTLQILGMIPVLTEAVDPIKNLFFGFVTISFFLLVVKRKSINNFKENLFLVIFLGWYILVIFINRDLNSVINIKYYLYMIFQLVVLVNYFNCLENPRSKIRNIVLWVSFVITIVLAISLVLYILNFKYSIVLNGSMYIIGIVNGRLTGLFGNANLTAVLAALCIFVEVFLIGKKIYRIPIILVLLLCLILSQSRGTILAFTISFSLFYVISKVNKTDRIITIKNTLKFVAVLVLSTSLLLFAMVQLRDIQTGFPETGNTNSSDEVETDRTESDNLRKALFFVGLNVFEDNPIVGVTASNIGYYAVPYIDNIQIRKDSPILNNPHNTIIQILASSGIVGAILLFAYFIRFMITSIVYIKNKVFSRLNIALMAIVLFFLLISQLETYIFFSSTLFASLFWLSSGSLTGLIKSKADDISDGY